MKAEPLEVGEHGLLTLPGAPGEVRVLNPDDETSLGTLGADALETGALGYQPVVEGGASTTHMKGSGGGRSEADPWRKIEDVLTRVGESYGRYGRS